MCADAGKSGAMSAAAKQSSSAAKTKRGSTGGSKQAKPVKSATKGRPMAAVADEAEAGSQGKRDALIGRCVRKDFETDSGVKAYSGWVIGVHKHKKW